MDMDFKIPLDGLAPGRTPFSWHVGKAFFASFDNTDILDADLRADALVEKSGKDIFLDLEIEGTVTVSCDRCLAEVDLPVKASPRMVIRFRSDDEMEGDREVLVPEDLTAADLHQVIYDYVYMSLPLQRVHPEGACDPETVKYLSHDREESPEGSPFAGLGRLFEKKNNN